MEHTEQAPSIAATIDSEASSTVLLRPQNQGDAEKWKPSLPFHLAIMSIGVGTFISGFAITSFPVIITDIAHDLSFSAIQTFWLPTLSTICLILSSFFVGPLSHVFGRQPIMIASMACFTPALIICFVAQDFGTMVIGRCFLGFGGGLVALSEVCITDMVPLRDRGRFMSYIMMPWVLGNALGPIIAGLLADRLNWRWAFYVLVPLAALCVLLFKLFLNLNVRQSSLYSKIKRIDYAGAILFTGATASFVIGISWGGILYAWDSYQTILPLVLGIVGLGIFVGYELKLPKEPVIQLRMLRNRTMWVTSIGNLFFGIIFTLVMYLLPYYFMACKSMTVLNTGLAQLAFQIPIFLASAICNPLMTRTASYRWCIILGFSLTTLGFGLFTLLSPSTSTAAWIFIVAALGAGIGALTMSQSYAVQAAAHASGHNVAYAISLQWTLRTFGNCIGLAMGGSALQNFLVKACLRDPVLTAKANEYGADAAALVGFVVSLSEDGEKGVLKHALEAAYAAALRDLWIVMAGLTGAVLLISLATQALSLDQVHSTEQGLRGRGEKGAEGDWRGETSPGDTGTGAEVLATT